MPTDTPLTPEAAAVWTAFNNGMEAGEVFACGPSEALAAALRELAAVAGRKVVAGGYILPGRVLTDKDIVAIADSIENAITYAEAPTDA